MKKINITKGKIKSAIRFAVYGPEGVGKSSFCSQFPDPVFIDTEGGTKQLDLARFDQPESWNDFLEEIDAVIADPSICKTLVIDTVDRAEILLTEDILTENKVDSIEQVGGGYGKGYTMLAERWNKELMKRLDKLIVKGVNITLVAHATTRKFESPDNPAYDRYEMKLSKKIAPMVKEWCDILMFTNYAVKVVEDKNKKAKAKGHDKRVMYFKHDATYDAKTRFKLEDGQPLSFEPLRPIYEGETAPVPEHTALAVDSPHEGIVEGDEILEDPRAVLLRRLAEAGYDQLTFEAWCVATGRLAPGGHIEDLSDMTVNSMLGNIDTLINLLDKGGKK